ncbi:hypothetical protein [Pseudomonas frederiksbergensis]|uniref:hypothetical protein n=1 Tax=Pseudomonas frederiksbergensis TaxID=104087 RepID=UPI000F4648A0|nr:hypothetical protein [Pseudomonas frederiksbergensis]RON44517.1 hypothetical protein BK667_27015 [Pseudomonas frederiksbergensis]
MSLFLHAKALASAPFLKRFNGTSGHHALLAGAVAVALAMGGAGHALAQGGGTAKPVKGLPSPFSTPTLPNPVFANPDAIHGFDVTGFIQNMTLDPTNANCPGTTDPGRFGGTVQLNGVTITVPCNTILQMPANTLTWADFVRGGSLALNKGPTSYPSFEIHVVGNTVSNKQIAGLIFVSQQAANAGSGYITRIDYTNGNLEVDSGTPLQPTIIQINDPSGRFGRAQSPDPRFSVDDANPTIHAATGYPMCVPRTISGDDALCPQKNRPKVVTPTTTNNCRNFSQAGVTPPASGELSPPVLGQAYCSQFVMKRFSDASRTATDPDPMQQAPFEVGDFISYAGTLFKSATAGTPDFISAHTIEANIGIYTQPGTQPSYLAIGEFGIGTADPSATAINGVAQETQDRIFLEASTTDVKTPVDIYLIDVNPSTGLQTNRWVTPYEMTGECNPAQSLPASCFGVSGGITSQNIGPQPQRARIRATKAPTGLLSQPTRTLRVVVRSLCVPQLTASQTAVDSCIQNAGRLTVANGLIAGQYVAPVFEFIFPEGVKPGDPVVPNDFWHLPFLRNGEGAGTPTGVGPLDPTPW